MVKKLVYYTNGQNYRRIWKSPGSLRLFHIKNPVFFRRVGYSAKEIHISIAINIIIYDIYVIHFTRR